MLERINFDLSHGYLYKSVLTQKEEDMDEEIIRTRILNLLSSLDLDKIECYHTCLPSGYNDAEMVFDYLILYKTDYGYKPIVIKNGLHQWCRPNKWFDKYYKEYDSDKEYNKRFNINEDEFEDTYFEPPCYTVNELLNLVCKSSRENLYEFLKEKYSHDIRQEILLF